MPNNQNLFNEKYRIPSARANWWEYGGGCYHVTIQTKNAIHYFGHIIHNPQTHQNEMIFSELGKFVNSGIPKIMDHYGYVNIMNHVVMPNHIHILIMIDTRGGDIELNNNNHQLCRDVPRNVSTHNCDEIPSPSAGETPSLTVSSADEKPSSSVSETPSSLHHDRRTSELMSSISPKTGSLSLVIRQFKQSVTIYAKQHHIPFAWQPRFYESVITKQYVFERVWQYIDNNVAKWHTH